MADFTVQTAGKHGETIQKDKTRNGEREKTRYLGGDHQGDCRFGYEVMGIGLWYHRCLNSM